MRTGIPNWNRVGSEVVEYSGIKSDTTRQQSLRPTGDDLACSTTVQLSVACVEVDVVVAEVLENGVLMLALRWLK